MNNCRAGLYSFAPTTTWLHKTGMASPPSLVMLGLTLPDSRILCGIASIGLTLANIAIILPHLRQPLLDSIRNAQSPVPTLASSTDRECESLPLDSSTTLESTIAEPLGCLDIDSKVASESYTILRLALLSDDTTDDDQAPPQVHSFPDTDSRESLVGSNFVMTREGRSALHIPLPVPDEAEVAFFDSTELSLSSPDLQEICTVAACGQLEKSTTDQHAAPTITTIIEVPDQRNPAMVDDILHLPDVVVAHDDTVSSGQNEPCSKDDLEKQRPESLEFVPQSVIRRYPSGPLVPARPCFGSRVFGGGRANQSPPALPHLLTQNPEMLLEGVKPRASYTTMEGHWCTPLLTEVQRRGQSMAGSTFVIETAPAQDAFEHGPTLLPEPPTIHKRTRLRKNPIHRRRPGILARASIRSRRSTTREYMNDTNDGSSTSDSDSESDSESQYSSGSSEDERMFPHMLGADLIAAINSNSESELNLLASKKTTSAPLDIYGDFLFSEDSAADISLIMQVSANDDASDSDIKAPATSRALTHEDIQQWATGVVQKCVRQVCRSRATVQPSSPSQASDVCAERPSSSGISQCPLSGLPGHCKLGGGATPAGVVPPSSAREPPGPLSAISTLPLAFRNIRDIPEFVPRQRYGSVVASHVEVPSARSLGMRSTIDVTRDAAMEVIARMESQAGFNARQRLVGVDEGRSAGGWQDSPRRV